MTLKKILHRLTLLLLAAVFLLCGWELLLYCREGRKSQTRYEELASQVADARPTETAATTVATFATEPSQAPTEPESNVLPEYRDLLEYNPHLVGWLTIVGTVIDYPVVQTPDRPEYYLYRNFDGEYSDWGCLFADAGCDVANSDNVIIYGHHMNDGSMFASLVDYENRSHWKDHPLIRFDTLTERRTYEIFAVIRTTATLDEGFPYHRFTDAETEAEFDLFVAECKALSLYDTGIIPEYGDKLLCLSTCEYTRQNGRFVVIGMYRPP